MRAIVPLAAAAVAVAVTLCTSATASADPGAGDPPAPPVPPAPADPVPAPPGPASALGPALQGPVAALTQNTQELMLGQYAVPSVPGSAPALAPDASVLAISQFLNPLNFQVQDPGPDAVPTSPYPLDPMQPGPFDRVNELRATHAMVHGALGRMNIADLGQPLPGTAPPAGTNIPPGPVQFLPDPAVAEAPLP
ncbi:hypothetical protein [Arthrobacter sp. SLBN-53]|uniref:hypothetical protein n=1 Tax=Arthrobacter sp. SLBN-53 TaxID=2768412 RepID=UPI00114EC2FD|nr:hypothetical protein [Arthrobacter sp. SLBN-53]TQK30724.1 hypothetical protein FBY28_3752 [Arthrobacter sp. SLBN-53]